MRFLDRFGSIEGGAGCHQGSTWVPSELFDLTTFLKEATSVDVKGQTGTYRLSFKSQHL